MFRLKLYVSKVFHAFCYRSPCILWNDCVAFEIQFLSSLMVRIDLLLGITFCNIITEINCLLVV